MLNIKNLFWICLLCQVGCVDRPDDDFGDTLLLAADNADQTILSSIEAFRVRPGDSQALADLGDGLIARGQLTGDPSRFETALRVADALATSSATPAGKLRARALLNLHRFVEAEHILQALPGKTSDPVVNVLFADALLEQGRLAEARIAYQNLMNLSPGALSYGRVANLHFLTGEIAEAIRLNQAAARAVHPRDLDLQSWLLGQAARYALAAGDPSAAQVLAGHAVSRSASVSSRFIWAQASVANGQSRQALEQLISLADDYPSPQVLGWLEALYRELGQAKNADAQATRAWQLGERIDPRGFAQWLIDHDRDLPRARRIIDAELGQRRDAQTLATLASLEWADNHPERAQIVLEFALESGLPSPNLHRLAAQTYADHRPEQAADHLNQAHQLRFLMRPGALAPVGNLSPAAIHGIQTADFVGNSGASDAPSNSQEQ